MKIIIKMKEKIVVEKINNLFNLLFKYILFYNLFFIFIKRKSQ